MAPVSTAKSPLKLVFVSQARDALSVRVHGEGYVLIR
jgi:hypothetical protein